MATGPRRPPAASPACDGMALVRAFISGTSTIEVSSTTSRSQSSGFSSVREKPPCFGSISSRRWMVLASIPVCSVMRLAARPVGAASATRTPLATSRRKMVSSSVVLPTPGPPVTTATLEPSTSFKASRCEAARVLPVRPSTQGMALSRSISGQGAGPDARSISLEAIACSDR